MSARVLILAVVAFFVFGPALEAGPKNEAIKLEADWHYVHAKKDGHVEAVVGDAYERGLPWHPGITVRQAVESAGIAPSSTIDVDDPTGKRYITAIWIQTDGKKFVVKYPFRKGDPAADTKLAPGSILQGGISGLR